MFLLCVIPHFHCMEISFCFMKSLGKVGPVVKGDRRVAVAGRTKGARLRFSHTAAGVRKEESGAAARLASVAGRLLHAVTGAAAADQLMDDGAALTRSLLGSGPGNGVQEPSGH